MKSIMTYLLTFLLAFNLIACKDKNQPQPDPTPEPQPKEYTQVRGYITSQYHDFVWENEQPSLQVYVVNPNPYDTVVPLKMTISSCNVLKKEIIDTITQMVRIKAGDSAAVYISPSKQLTPEIYKVSMLLNNQTICTALASTKKAKAFNIAVDPMKIVSPYDGKADFDQFWADTKQELRALYQDHEVKLDTYKVTSDAIIYFFEARSLKNMGDTLGVVRGYYSEPIAAGAYPCYIQFPGYDTPGQKFHCPLSGSATRCEMHVSPRGQYANATAPYKNEYGEWIKYGLQSKETYYYRGAYMDAVRMVDFVFSREKVDTTHVFAYGSSQGGALTLAAAALSDHHFAAISPCVPFLGDWPDFWKLSNGFPGDLRTAAKKEGMTEEQALEVLSYIDIKNLAHKITCPVLEIICLQDDVVPPHTNASIYNNLDNCPDKGERLYISPLENHAWAKGWDKLRNDFFDKYSK